MYTAAIWLLLSLAAVWSADRRSRDRLLTTVTSQVGKPAAMDQSIAIWKDVDNSPIKLLVPKTRNNSWIVVDRLRIELSAV